MTKRSEILENNDFSSTVGIKCIELLIKLLGFDDILTTISTFYACYVKDMVEKYQVTTKIKIDHIWSLMAIYYHVRQSWRCLPVLKCLCHYDL